jgi:hypothetical protein
MKKVSFHFLSRCAIIVPASLLFSCATVHSAFMTNISATPKQGRTIEASSSKFVFLAFNFDNEYAFETQRKLAGACPNGTVTGILTTFETRWYVLFTDFAVKAKGLCVQTKHANIPNEALEEKMALAGDGRL